MDWNSTLRQKCSAGSILLEDNPDHNMLKEIKQATRAGNTILVVSSITRSDQAGVISGHKAGVTFLDAIADCFMSLLTTCSVGRNATLDLVLSNEQDQIQNFIMETLCNSVHNILKSQRSHMNNKSKSTTAVLNFKKRKMSKLVQKKLKGAIKKIKSL